VQQMPGRDVYLDGLLAGEIALKSPEPDATMKRTLSVRSPSPADKKPSHGNFALQ
jgi:hypothetical protein